MDYHEYKLSALHILRGKWKQVVLVTFIAALLGGLAFGSGVDLTFGLDSEDLEFLPSFVHSYLRTVAPIALVLGIVQLIVGGMVNLGYCRYLLNLHDGNEASLKDLFSYSDRFLDALCLSFMTGLFTFLWSLLFIIPGIIASLRYSMAPFIMCENPHYSAPDAINESKAIMEGNKLDLFLLQLSFIGWSILSVFTLGIGDLWLNPYRNMTITCFYRNL